MARRSMPGTCRRDLARIAGGSASSTQRGHVRVGTTVDEAERLLILRTLEATGQNKTRAAEILGVSLKTLHNKLKEYGRERHETETALPQREIPGRSRSAGPSKSANRCA
jgi:DNA-binding NtrC family response regulator